MSIQDNSTIKDSNNTEYTGLEVAVIGLSARFPGAKNTNEFWHNLTNAVESVKEFTDEELLDMGVTPEQMAHVNFVKSGAPMEGSEKFDAQFFGFSPAEAEILDPQHRVFLECAWNAMENAGYYGESFPGNIGVFASSSMSSYVFNLYGNANVRSRVTPYELFVANDKDFLATRIAYKMNLTGPAIAVQTACSSSLVAIHMACQSLISGESDMALAGGVSIVRQQGYLAQEGSILSADGHCRPFDAKANGTVAGNGVGVVVLKRLSDAIEDNDTIDAVIKGSAINNDGGVKASFTAPQVDRQAAVIDSALAVAEASADSIQYVETHGTATFLGDPIEFKALNEVYQNKDNNKSKRNKFCTLGSVKSNIGHLDTAAGVAGLIKTVLALKHNKIPATLHYNSPNPQIDLLGSPFNINSTLSEWPETAASDASPKRAAVSSFGIGGTNAHAILEEAPKQYQSQTTHTPKILVVSAKTPSALQKTVKNISNHIQQDNKQSLTDVAYTLQAGRAPLKYRQFVVGHDRESLVQQFNELVSCDKATQEDAISVIFQFPGQGSQYIGMTQSLYQENSIYRQALDSCIHILEPLIGEDINALLQKSEENFVRTLLLENDDTQADVINQTAFTQPLLFAVEYSLAQLWLSLGVQPSALHGHSLGEYVAACIAGVFNLQTALELVVERARLMQSMPTGTMLAVYRSEELLQEFLNQDISLAATNSPDLSVLSGSTKAIELIEQRFKNERIFCRALPTSHAFHSSSMQGMCQDFKVALQKVSFNAPQIPIISNLTGTWLTEEQATNPDYWIDHLLNTVRFTEGVQTLLKLPNPLFLEVGPKQVLTTLVQHSSENSRSISSLREPKSSATDHENFLRAVGRLWCAGSHIQWENLYDNATFDEQKQITEPRRVHLPGYPFEGERYFINASPVTALQLNNTEASGKNDDTVEMYNDISQWIYRPTWLRSSVASRAFDPTNRRRWLLFDNETTLAEQAMKYYERFGEEVQRVQKNNGYGQIGYRKFGIDENAAEQYKQVLDEIVSLDYQPTHILYLWSLEESTNKPAYQQAIELQLLINALATLKEPIQLFIVTDSAHCVTGDEKHNPNQALIQGLCQVVNQEIPLLACRQIDVEFKKIDNKSFASILCKETHAEQYDMVVAYRNNYRWTYNVEPSVINSDAITNNLVTLRKHANHLIIGDLNQGLGKVWAEFLVKNYNANLLLIHPPAANSALSKEALSSLNISDNHIIQCCADIEDSNAIRKIIQESKLGTINGVFFSTPMTNESSAAPIMMLSEKQWQYNQSTKINALQALKNAFKGLTPEFFCIQSSLSSTVGGLGLGAYSGANHYIDSFCSAANSADATPWFSINWDACSDAVPEKVTGNSSKSSTDTGWGGDNEFSLSGEDVWRLTERILQCGDTGQTIVSRGNLLARRKQWLSAEPKVTVETVTVGSRHARPNLDTPLIAPRNDIETKVAEILQNLLGIEEIGVQDNFYDLGGHSLLAIQAIAQLRDAFPVNVEMRELLLEQPTAERISNVISQQMPAQNEMEEIAALLAEIKDMESEDLDKAINNENTATQKSSETESV